MFFVNFLILLATVQHAFADGGSCNQVMMLTASNETNPRTSIHSPNYPNSYPNNINCIWTITAPPGKKVKFTFNRMVLEYYNAACTADYVELRSGLNSYSSRIGRYCGSTPPTARYSSGRYMWVKFHSDQSSTFSGFSANYEAVDYGKNPADNYGGSCNQVMMLTASNETNPRTSIHSPNYPNSYPNNINCIWTITAPPGKKVKFTFNRMVLEYYNAACTADYVELRSGLNSYSSRIGRYCGSTPPTARYSSGRYMWVKFHSDQSSTFSGFSANYEAVDYGKNPADNSHQGTNRNTSTRSSSSGGSIGGIFIVVFGFIFLIALVIIVRWWWRRQRTPAVIVHEVVEPAAATTVVVQSNVNVNQPVASAPPLTQPQPSLGMVNPHYPLSQKRYAHPHPQPGYAPTAPPLGYAYPQLPHGAPYPAPAQGYPHAPPPEGANAPPPPYSAAPVKQ